MMESSEFKDIIKEADKAWIETKKYLEMGGDITYAYLKLALKDLKLIEHYISDSYCRRQVKAEIDLLDHAIKLALIAYQWNLGAGGLWGKIKLWIQAVKETAIILLIQLKKL